MIVKISTLGSALREQNTLLYRSFVDKNPQIFLLSDFFRVVTRHATLQRKGSHAGTDL